MTGCTPLRKRRVIGLAASSALFIAAVVGITQARPLVMTKHSAEHGVCAGDNMLRGGNLLGRLQNP